MDAFTGITTWNNSAKDNRTNNHSSIKSNNLPKAGSLWNYNPTLSFDATTSNDSFNVQIKSLGEILENNEGTIIAVASYTRNGITKGGVTGYYRNYQLNEFSLHHNLSWYRARISGVQDKMVSAPKITQMTTMFQFKQHNLQQGLH